MDKGMRLDRFFTDMGLGTRSQVKDLARQGRIQVNGVTMKKTDKKVEPGRDTVTLDGVRVEYAQKEYYMLNKPQGVVSATEDNLHNTVIDLIRGKPPKGAEKDVTKDSRQGPKRKDLFPVGRLDIDAEGLLLITNDGELAHRLLSPKHHVDKRYFAKVAGVMPQDVRKRFEEGLTLGDGTKLMPAFLEPACGPQEEDKETANVILTIREGKFHQVKRMFEAVGCKVVYLKRLSMGSLVLDERLAPGEYRALSQGEVEAIKQG